MRSLPAPTHVALRGGPTLHWGVLAPGEIAHDWTTALHAHTDQRVVAVASRSAERASAFAAAHGIERHYASYRALVDDPGVDIVYVAAPHSEHLALGLLAIQAGKHVLIEKPIALSAREAQQLVDAARAANVFAMEAMWSRFLPQTTVVAQLLADGALGAPRAATADFGSRFPYAPSGRWFDPALGGGALLDLGVYSVWWNEFVLGAPASVSAAGSLADTGVDEQAVVTLGHPDAVGIASCSMVAPTPTEATLSGEDGWLRVDAPFCAPGGLAVHAAGETVRWDDPTTLRWRDGLCYQAVAVAQHIADGRTEAPEHPLDRSVSQLRTIDIARSQLGAA